MRTLRWRKPETWIVRRPQRPGALFLHAPGQALLLGMAIFAFAPVQHQIATGTFHWSLANVVHIGSVVTAIGVGATMVFYRGVIRRTETAFASPAAETELDTADQAVARYFFHILRLPEVTVDLRAEFAGHLDRTFREYVERLHALAAARVSHEKWSAEAGEASGVSAFVRELTAPDPISDHEDGVREAADAFDIACVQIANAAADV